MPWSQSSIPVTRPSPQLPGCAWSDGKQTFSLTSQTSSGPNQLSQWLFSVHTVRLGSPSPEQLDRAPISQSVAQMSITLCRIFSLEYSLVFNMLDRSLFPRSKRIVAQCDTYPCTGLRFRRLFVHIGKGVPHWKLYSARMGHSM